jgi:membrane-associated protein
MGGGNLERLLTDFFAQSSLLACGVILTGIFIQTANPIGILVPGNILVFLSAVLAKVALPGGWVLLAFGMAMAAFLGNGVGYATGAFFGDRAFSHPRLVDLKPKLEDFFEKHGAKAVGLAFFIPFIRSGMPLLAGSIKVAPKVFVLFSALGALAWISVFVVAGAVFGEIPLVRQNLDYVVVGVGAVVVLQILGSKLRASRVRRDSGAELGP